MPIVTTVDFGHTDPMWTVPQGTTVHMDPTTQAIRFTGLAVS